MSKFLEILKKALSDPKYGYELRVELCKEMNKEYGLNMTVGCYGNEDCLKEQDAKIRKNL